MTIAGATQSAIDAGLGDRVASHSQDAGPYPRRPHQGPLSLSHTLSLSLALSLSLSHTHTHTSRKSRSGRRASPSATSPRSALVGKQLTNHTPSWYKPCVVASPSWYNCWTFGQPLLSIQFATNKRYTTLGRSQNTASSLLVGPRQASIKITTRMLQHHLLEKIIMCSKFVCSFFNCLNQSLFVIQRLSNVWILERISIELVTSDCKLKASREVSV